MTANRITCPECGSQVQGYSQRRPSGSSTSSTFRHRGRLGPLFWFENARHAKHRWWVESKACTECGHVEFRTREHLS